MEITKLPEHKPRVESGAIQFGDDWPGLFLRGDEAFFWQMECKSALDGNRDQKLVLQNLYQLFGFCNLTNYNQ